MKSANPQPIQDVKPAGAGVFGDLIEAELQHNIPIKAPEQRKEAAVSNPITAPRQFGGNDTDQNDAELDHILKDVNKKVEVPDDQKHSKFRLFHKKPAAKKQKTPNPNVAASKPKKPVLAILIALLVAGGLSVAAYYAFKTANKTTAGTKSAATAGKVGTNSAATDSIQAAGGKLVQPSDISNLSSTLQSQINGLNDGQDFNQTPINDQSLGL